jgi:hypothetical protein
MRGFAEVSKPRAMHAHTIPERKVIRLDQISVLFDPTCEQDRFVMSPLTKSASTRGVSRYVIEELRHSCPGTNHHGHQALSHTILAMQCLSSFAPCASSNSFYAHVRPSQVIYSPPSTFVPVSINPLNGTNSEGLHSHPVFARSFRVASLVSCVQPVPDLDVEITLVGSIRLVGQHTLD